MRYSEQSVQVIFDTTFALLATKDFRRLSMADIGRACGVSKETLYRWFGNKNGLFTAMIRARSEQINEAMDTLFREPESDPFSVVERFAYWYLLTVLDDRSVRINQIAIAAAHEEPQLARILLENGRENALPRLAEQFGRYQSTGVLATDISTELLTESLLGLAAGDLQIRRLLNAIPHELEDDILRDRARSAAARFFKAFGTA